MLLQVATACSTAMLLGLLGIIITYYDGWDTFMMAVTFF
jgi:hypothetical protein